MKPEHPEFSPLVVLPDWDGVHLWVDELHGSTRNEAPGTRNISRFDLRFTASAPFQQQLHYGVTLPFVISAPFHHASIEARPAIDPPDESAWRPLRQCKLLAAADLEVAFAFAKESPIIPLAAGTICVARRGDHACAWEVVFPMSGDGSVLILRPVNLSPRHLLNAPGEAVIHIDPAAGVMLYNTEPSPSRRYRVLGPAADVTPCQSSRDSDDNPGAIFIALTPPSPKRQPTEETLWKPVPSPSLLVS